MWLKFLDKTPFKLYIYLDHNTRRNKMSQINISALHEIIEANSSTRKVSRDEPCPVCEFVQEGVGDLVVSPRCSLFASQYADGQIKVPSAGLNNWRLMSTIKVSESRPHSRMPRKSIVKEEFRYCRCSTLIKRLGS